MHSEKLGAARASSAAPLVRLVAGAARLAIMDMPKAKTPEERTTKKYKTPDDFLAGPRGPPPDDDPTLYMDENGVDVRTLHEDWDHSTGWWVKPWDTVMREVKRINALEKRRAIFVIRSGEREDYKWFGSGKNWVGEAGNARPWDPPMTREGNLQAFSSGKYPAIAEIFDSGVGATLSLRPAGLYVPLGAPLRWGVVQQRVVLGRRGDPEPGRYRQICIAILTAKNNHTIIGQADGDLHAYEESDRLVVIERDLRPPPPEAAPKAKTPKAAPKAKTPMAAPPAKPASPRVVPPPAVHRPPPMGTFSPPPKQTNDAPAAADPGPPPTAKPEPAKAAPLAAGYVPRSLRDLKKNSRGLPPPSGGLPPL
jgi:hypothetical protein